MAQATGICDPQTTAPAGASRGRFVFAPDTGGLRHRLISVVPLAQSAEVVVSHIHSYAKPTHRHRPPLINDPNAIISLLLDAGIWIGELRIAIG